MSTRCQIKIAYQQRDVLLSHHYDGYPAGVGVDLLLMQKKLNTLNGNILVNKLIKKNHQDNEYEFAFQVHTDLDYWYEIDCHHKTIRCWKAKSTIYRTTRK